jgi:hypothetical protein
MPGAGSGNPSKLQGGNMKNLKSVLSRHYVPVTVLGAEHKIDAERLQDDLAILKRRVNLNFWISVIMIALVFVIGIFILLIFVKNPIHASAFFGAMGISVSGAIEYMRRIWKEMAQINLLIILSSNLSDEIMSSVIQTLVNKI